MTFLTNFDVLFAKFAYITNNEKTNEKSRNKRLMKNATNLAADCLPNMGATK